MILCEFRIVKVLYGDVCVDAVIRLNVEHVLDCPALRCLAAFRYVIDLEPEATALLCEEKDVVVRGGCENMLNEVFVTFVTASGTYSAASLQTIFGKCGTLDVA